MYCLCLMHQPLFQLPAFTFSCIARPLLCMYSSDVGIIMAGTCLQLTHLGLGEVATSARGSCQDQLAYQVLKTIAAKQHNKEISAVHEVYVQAFCAMLFVALPPLCIPQHLPHASTHFILPLV